MRDSFLIFASDRVKMLYAEGKTDDEISLETGIPIPVIEKMLENVRLPIKMSISSVVIGNSTGGSSHL